MTRHERLLDQLRSYAAQDDAEKRHRDAILDLLGKTEAFSRSHFDPGHVTASCYVVDGEGRMLLHHHRRLNRWLQMGGHVDALEGTEEAALREGEEESGLPDLALAPGILDLDVHVIPDGRGEPEHRHFDVRYLAHTFMPEAARIDRNESNELAWVTLDRASELMPGAESRRAVGKIARLLQERSLR